MVWLVHDVLNKRKKSAGLVSCIILEISVSNEKLGLIIYTS